MKYIQTFILRISLNTSDIKVTVFNITTEDIAYFAGLFDGEGCVGLYNRSDGNGFASSISITNTNRIPLDELQSKFGGYVNSKKGIAKNFQLIHNWVIYGKSSVKFLNLILPYLRIKTPQVLLLLEYKNMSKNKFRYTPESLERVNNICSEIKSLKKKVCIP